MIFNGDVQEAPKKLSYDIRIHEPYVDWKIDQRFVKTHVYAPDQGCLFVFIAFFCFFCCFVIFALTNMFLFLLSERDLKYLF